MKSTAPVRVRAALLAALVYLAGCGGTVTSTEATRDRPTGADSGAPIMMGSAGAPNRPSADWTMLGYDLASTYWNRGETRISKKSVASLEKAWEFDTGASGTGAGATGTPVIAGGTVYVASVGVVAIDLATGSEIWRTGDFASTSSLALSGGVLYLHDSKSVVHALRASDGTEMWRVASSEDPTAVGFSSPVVTKDYVLVGGSTLEEVAAQGPVRFQGFVAALRKDDGALAWQTFTATGDEHGASIWSTVSVDPTLALVYGATGNNHGPPAGPTSDAFVAMPLMGGSIRWSQQIYQGDIFMQGVAGPEVDFGANPIVFDSDGRKLVAGGNKGGDFWTIERETGAVIVKRNLGPGSSFKGGIFVAGAWDGKHLLTACNGATSSEPGSEPATPMGFGNAAVLYALDPLTLDIVWARQVAGPVYGPITVANGVGFFGKNTTLQAFDTDTGEVLKEISTEGTIASAPAISNGYVVFGSGMSWTQATQGSKYYALKVP